jgi:hypothetical protein
MKELNDSLKENDATTDEFKESETLLKQVEHAIQLS